VPGSEFSKMEKFPMPSSGKLNSKQRHPRKKQENVSRMPM